MAPFRQAITRLSELFADTITGATINGGEIIGAIITGSLFRTAASGKRVEISDDTGTGWLRFWGLVTSGNPGLLSPGRVISDGDTVLGVASPDQFGNNNGASILLSGEVSSGSADAVAQINAVGTVELNSTAGTEVQTGGLKIGTGTLGRKINVLDWAHNNNWGNTNGTGDIIITLDCGVAPLVVLWTDDNGNNPYRGAIVPGSSTATQFTVRFRNTTTNAVAAAGIGMGGSFVAIA